MSHNAKARISESSLRFSADRELSIMIRSVDFDYCKVARTTRIDRARRPIDFKADSMKRLNIQTSCCYRKEAQTDLTCSNNENCWIFGHHETQHKRIFRSKFDLRVREIRVTPKISSTVEIFTRNAKKISQIRDCVSRTLRGIVSSGRNSIVRFHDFDYTMSFARYAYRWSGRGRYKKTHNQRGCMEKGKGKNRNSVQCINISMKCESFGK